MSAFVNFGLVLVTGSKRKIGKNMVLIGKKLLEPYLKAGTGYP